MDFIVNSIEITLPDTSWPDVDSDLAEHPITHYDRDTVIDYLASQYGDDCIAYVGNRNYYSLKSALIGLGQVYAIPSKETTAASKELNPDNIITNPIIVPSMPKFKQTSLRNQPTSSLSSK